MFHPHGLLTQVRLISAPFEVALFSTCFVLANSSYSAYSVRTCVYVSRVARLLQGVVKELSKAASRQLNVKYKNQPRIHFDGGQGEGSRGTGGIEATF